MTFDSQYVTTNNRPGAPIYDPSFIKQLKNELVADAPDLAPIVDPLLASLAIGAHRADIPPRLLDDALQQIDEDSGKSKDLFEQFRAVVMIVWPFTGIPWCVPACLGMANVLEKHNLLQIARGRARPVLGEQHIAMGQELQKRTYALVQNSEVQEILRDYFADFTLTSWAVVFGYGLAETTNLEIFTAPQTQLILAAAITSSGATRQAKSHLKGAMGLGIAAVDVKAVLKAAKALNAWNGVENNDIDVDELDQALRAVSK